MDKVLIFGHQSPDTDAICSAIVYADLKTKSGMNVEAVRLGNVNSETQFALDYFQVDAPRLVDQVSNEVKNVILVDHNERQQSAVDIDQVQVLEVIDHHRIANFETSAPLYYRAEPIGCTATILCKMYEEKGIAISKEMAGLMLSAIISDSLLFKSPTCTEEEVNAARKLAKIAGVDAESYGLEMLKAGTELSSKSAEQLIAQDAKEFQLGDIKVVIAQVNAVNLSEVYERQAELEAVIKEVMIGRGIGLFLFVVTDILNQDSEVLVLGSEVDVVEKAFNTTLLNNRAVLKGVVSRKLQIIPVLTKAFENIHA